MRLKDFYPPNIAVLSSFFFLLLLIPITLTAQADTNTTLGNIQKNLVEARTKGNYESFVEAEKSLDQILQNEPKNTQALIMRGQTKLERAGLLAKQGKFEDSGSLTTQATVDLDAAVNTTPKEIQPHLARGLVYSQFPGFMNKNQTAVEDLEFVIKAEKFSSLKTATQARVYLVLGKNYLIGGQKEKSAMMFRNAVKADANSEDGTEAQEELEKLENPVAVDSQGNVRSDRFSQVDAKTSPIIVAATVTVPIHKSGWNRENMPATMQKFLKDTETQKGFLGMRVMQDVDNPTMLLILTWWQDKSALNNWFYSNTHQGIIKDYYVQGANQSNNSNSNGKMSGASQIGMELFTSLPGGIRYGGGLTPEKALNTKSKP